MSMELSLREQQLVQTLRDAVEAEVIAFRHRPQEAEDFCYHLTTNNRHLEAENKVLTELLDEHGISAPFPYIRYMNTPSP
jgi:hypothetical protein